MTHQEILTMALKKAVEGGWHPAHDYTVKNGHIYDLDNLQSDDLIYYHLFAKALWGDEHICITCGTASFMSTKINRARNGYTKVSSNTPAKYLSCMNCDYTQVGKMWQLNLQQMVLADDPIEYLGEHI